MGRRGMLPALGALSALRPRAHAEAPSPPLTLYGHHGCPSCSAMDGLLKQRGAKFSFKDPSEAPPGLNVSFFPTFTCAGQTGTLLGERHVAEVQAFCPAAFS
eukprot:TRINITY_DN14095_c0_g1_i1.p3 TRINITY_DN14095_c0_g1~~TRINITY_DN14095_c0_g1_i1.p3  ORF type:complete len:102 (+),score=27.18 TRINITY_DN14095_c0_g1_i1:94-399(+)